MNIRRLLLGILWLPLLAFGATEYQSHASILAAVNDLLSIRAGANNSLIDITPLDRRLRMQRCDNPLETATLPNAKLSGAVLVEVRCTGQTSWKLFVRARVERNIEVVVASRALARGARIVPGDLQRMVVLESKAGAGYLSDEAAIVGKVLVRTITAGSIINQSNLDLPRAIRRGERVSIIANGVGLNVSMEGKALADGAIGEIIRVKNRSSQREIDAEVIGGGVVRVRM